MAPAAPSIHSRLLALAALSTGFSLISSAFGFYYVKVFLDYFHIQESWFQFAQTLYMVWNAINDPLFAYLQDSTNFTFTRTRRESVLYAAPLFAISFLLPWFPWGNTDGSQAWMTGLHLIVALCFWDTMFTYVGLAYCCIFTEISKDNEIRLKMVRYSQIGSLIGSSSVFILQYFSDQLNNFAMFQFLCIIIAVLSCLLMVYTGKHGHTEKDLQNQLLQKKGEKVEEKYQQYSYITLTKQVLFNRDFLAFVSCNFLQEFHRSFLGGFLAIFCDQLIPKTAISDFIRSSFYGGSRIVPHVLVIFGTPFVSHLGYFKVIRYSFVWKILGAGIFYFIGSETIWLLIIFLVCDGAFANASFSLFNMPLSDIADEDTENYSRKHPITSMVYGTNALVVKPAISLAPMIVVAILNRYGYDQLQKKTLTEIQIEDLKSVMFTLVCFIPFVIGILQSVFWSYYTIRENKKVNISINVGMDIEEI